MMIMTLAAVFATVSIYGCTESFPEEHDSGTALTDTVVFLPNTAGAVVEVVARMQDEWSLSNGNSWVEISPEAGSAGTVTLTMRVLEPNTSLAERVSHAGLTVGDEVSDWWLVQEGTAGLDPVSSEYTVGGAGGNLRMEVLANAEFTVSCDAEWVEISDVLLRQDSTLLDDGVTYSALQTAYIDVVVSENEDVRERAAVFALTCAGKEYTVTLRQSAGLSDEVDWSKAFYRKSLCLKFTGQSCANCPRMSENMERASEERPGRLELMNIHSFSSSDELYYGGSQKWVSHYLPGSYPSGIFNSMARLSNIGDLYDRIERLIDESVELYPAKTALAVRASFDGTTLVLDGYVATKELQDYKIHIFVLQDDIIAEQAGAEGDYEHDAVLRYAVTDELGDALSGTGEQKVVSFSKEVTLPSDVFYGGEKDNAYLLIYTTYDSKRSPSGSVPDVTYTNFGMVVDNVISLPLNGFVTFGYEQ